MLHIILRKNTNITLIYNIFLGDKHTTSLPSNAVLAFSQTSWKLDVLTRLIL